MVFLHEFIALILVHIAAMIIPGPDFILVMHQTLSKGKRFGLFTSLGIACGLLMHISYTLLGVGLIISQSPMLFAIVEVLGGGYLLWICINLLRADQSQEWHQGKAQVAPQTAIQAFSRGFFCNLFNPKVSLFFLAIFTSIVDKTTPIEVQVVYGVVMVMLCILWFFTVTLMFSHQVIRDKYLGKRLLIERLVGGIIGCFSLKLLYSALQTAYPFIVN
ncbi:MAG: LysE family translocator [Cellvibrionales bacterium]|nr:LysE family translocator [Cellvibrionales bacterium]